MYIMFWEKQTTDTGTYVPIFYVYQIRYVKNITIHPDYDTTWTDGESVDIAIITLDRPADIVPGVVETIKLQRRKYENENGKKLCSQSML